MSLHRCASFYFSGVSVILSYEQQQAAEICVYPDSSKVGVFNGEDTTYHLYPSSAAVTYFHGEPHLECPKETSK